MESSGLDHPEVYPLEWLVSPKCLSYFHGIRTRGFPITNSLDPQSTKSFAEYNQGLPSSIGKGLPELNRIITKFCKYVTSPIHVGTCNNLLAGMTRD